MDPFYLNNSCDPFASRETPCQIGSYVQYAVNVSEPQHVFETIKFVKQHNIRFVVKNTGHDYMGKSTGTGAISIWTHHLQNITWIPQFTSPRYIGPAFKVRAGVRGIDLVREADKRGLVIISGECATVGFAGGYTQGGGHSALSSFYGLAADQTLEFEVITTQGKYVVASPTQNTELFWALSGGGGGTYGIVWSVTVKAHPDLPVTIATLQFTSDGIPEDLYWEAIEAYQASTRMYTDEKVWALATYNNATFTVNPFFAVNKGTDEVEALIRPLLSSLDNLEINYTSSVRPFNTYLEAYSDFLLNLPGFNILLGSRLLPRDLWNDKEKFKQMVKTIRDIVSEGTSAYDLAMKPSLEVAGHPENSVHPAWREAEKLFEFSIVISDGESVEQMRTDEERITTVLMPALKRLAPDSVAYLNEANVGDPDFRKEFYGSLYDPLLAIKDKWDPDEILYGSTSVGGDRWKETSDGRLCKTHAVDAGSSQAVS
ncbi:hypothetical protein V5O48_007549 [Marasmius crinis-equi]|uniref:FAD-binding PCMH-type domain-containing protein n=1 Tax=Marasmius crinis-equi TaxID=585013 RepID=A0ABR3FGJ6_9AGAR